MIQRKKTNNYFSITAYVIPPPFINCSEKKKTIKLAKYHTKHFDVNTK